MNLENISRGIHYTYINNKAVFCFFRYISKIVQGIKKWFIQKFYDNIISV